MRTLERKFDETLRLKFADIWSYLLDAGIDTRAADAVDKARNAEKALWGVRIHGLVKFRYEVPEFMRAESLAPHFDAVAMPYAEATSLSWRRKVVRDLVRHAWGGSGEVIRDFEAVTPVYEFDFKDVARAISPHLGGALATACKKAKVAPALTRVS